MTQDKSNWSHLAKMAAIPLVCGLFLVAYVYAEWHGGIRRCARDCAGEPKLTDTVAESEKRLNHCTKLCKLNR